MSITRSQRGFTLIEVMVAFLVLAIGLLGVAGLQNTSVHSNQSSYLRTQAMVLAFDMAERLRSNIVGASTGQYVGSSGSAVSACNSSSGCQPSQLASNDAYEWQQQVSTVLPSGAGRVCGASASVAILQTDGTCAAGCASAFSAADPYYAVLVEWADTTTNNTQCYVTKVRM